VFVNVAVPLAIPGTLTYSVPPELRSRAVAGARVVVPIKGRQTVGIIVAAGRPAPSMTARPVISVAEGEPVLDEPLLRLAEWVGQHYAAAPGPVLRAMLPGALFSTRPPGSRAPELTERVYALAGETLTLLERERRFRRSPRRRQAYEALEQLSGRASAGSLRQAGISPEALRSLVREGLAEVQIERRERDPFAAVATTPVPGKPTADQLAALGQLESLGAGEAALLFGVTGSGKTLVYLEYLRRLVDRGRSVIVLVPEIGLTPQTVARFRGVFGDQVAVLHSRLSEGERYDAWTALREGRKRVAVGARSAVFAAVPSLGAIVLDEEHDSSYKQADPAPRYHARLVALRRAKLSGATVVLGSATPSLETWAAASNEAIRLIRLPRRVSEKALPAVQVVDLREAPVTGGPVAWSEDLDQALRGALARGEQAMLLLNRRGFSMFLQCPSCGAVTECPNCSVALTYHRSPPGLRCHHCDHRAPVPGTCAGCGEPVQKFRGAGTQQVEAFVSERFPEARIARMDVDAASGKWDHHRILDDVARGRVDVLVGTQMIAKGLDFPNVTLVGVVDADVALNLPDFRAAERTFQLLTQVAGRTGRGSRQGRVIVQTRQPSHPAIALAARHDAEGFAKAEYAERRDPPYPPHSHLANVVLSGTAERQVEQAAVKLAGWLEALFKARPASRADLLGPAPCPIGKIRGRFRWHCLLRARDAAKLTRLVGYVASHAPPLGSVRLVIDRDPVALL